MLATVWLLSSSEAPDRELGVVAVVEVVRHALARARAFEAVDQHDLLIVTADLRTSW